MGATLMRIPLKNGGVYKLSSKDDSIPCIMDCLAQTGGKPFENRDEVTRFCKMPREQRELFIQERKPAVSDSGQNIQQQGGQTRLECRA